MQLELVPDPGADGPVARAAVAALGRVRLLETGRGSGWGAAWRRAGLEEAVERDVARGVYGVGSPLGGATGRAAVPPAPSSRGATRA